MKISARLVLAFVPAILLLTTFALRAQKPTNPPIAPIPSQILSAQNVFISNATGTAWAPPGDGDLMYNEFYAAIKSQGKYKLLSSPASADVIFELRYSLVEVREGTGEENDLTVVILDPGTHSVLWAFTERVKQSGTKSAWRKSFDKAATALAGDVRKLGAAPLNEGPEGQ
jgi:hypothetical protein